MIVRSVPAMIQVMEARTATELRLSTSHERTDDARRFESIYREHFGSVAAYARRRVPARADDVVAETFLVAWRRLDDVPADALPWLFGVARRVVSDFRRGSRRQDAVADRLASFGEPRASAHAESDEALRSALAPGCRSGTASSSSSCTGRIWSRAERRWRSVAPEQRLRRDSGARTVGCGRSWIG